MQKWNTRATRTATPELLWGGIDSIWINSKFTDRLISEKTFFGAVQLTVSILKETPVRLYVIYIKN